MSETQGEAPEGRPRGSFPFRELARVLALPLLAVGIFVLFFLRPAGMKLGGKRGFERVDLLQKDSSFQPVPPSKGGATGTVWYKPSGAPFTFRLEARHLKPDRRYLVEVAVDETIYTLASHRATSQGSLAIDTTLTRFAEGVCVGPNWDVPKPLAGPHVLRFWVKADGNPASGTGRQHSPQFADGADLPCSGNGDGNYAYVLLENEVANYRGAGTGKESEPKS